MTGAPEELASGRRWPVISALGIVEVFNWGTTYYLPAIIARPIAAGTGWGYDAIVAGLSLAFFVSGIVSVPVGRAIDRHGGRPVLTLASLLLAAGLAILAAAPTLPVFLLGWGVLGLGMGAGLYDAAFSSLGRLYGLQARSAISSLTLIAGFSSTLCWPLSAFLLAQLGWRGTCLVYAGVHLLVLMPLIRLFVPPVPEKLAASHAVGGQIGGRIAEIGKFRLLGAILTLGAAVSTVMAVHLITFLADAGLTTAEAVAIGTLIGPAQVAARLVERLIGTRLHPIWLLVASVLSVLLGIGLITWHIHPLGLGFICFGIGFGIWSIARGTLPLALFGAEGYGLVMGKLARPVLIAQALAPAVGAIAIDRLGSNGALMSLFGICALNTLLMLALFILTDRRAIG